MIFMSLFKHFRNKKALPVDDKKKEAPPKDPESGKFISGDDIVDAVSKALAPLRSDNKALSKRIGALEGKLDSWEPEKPEPKKEGSEGDGD